MKKILIYIIVFIVTMSFLYAFSSSRTSHSMENLAYVVAMGIDKGENNNRMKVTFQFIKVSSLAPDTSSEESPTVITEVNANTIDNAVNLLNTYIGKEVNLSHCSLIVFSEDFAKEGLATEIYSLMNNVQVRPSANILISNTTASMYLNSLNPNIEEVVTKYYDTFPITSTFTGYSQNINLGEFFNSLSCSTCSSTAMLGEATSEEESSSIGISGERNTQNIGIAVFDKDYLVGELSPIETICHLLIIDDVESCIISFSNEDTGSLIDVSLSRNKKPKITVDTSKEFPNIKIKLSLEAKVLTVEKNYNYTDTNVLDKISSSAEKYLKENISNYLNKVSREFNADIDKFDKYAAMHFLDNKSWEEYSWKDKFKNATFDLDINVNVSSSLLLTKQESTH